MKKISIDYFLAAIGLNAATQAKWLKQPFIFRALQRAAPLFVNLMAAAAPKYEGYSEQQDQ
ncbi:hypothetical protein, partial [Pedobacter sp. AK013]|uniref:hypothetical protein n=1 Tax=Pedobacter sp. AK013 TaxID=2723071 RepID=UPI00160B581A